MKTREELNALKEEELKEITGGSSIPGLETIGPYNNLTQEEIQALRELGDSMKPTTQNIR